MACFLGPSFHILSLTRRAARRHLVRRLARHARGAASFGEPPAPPPPAAVPWEKGSPGFAGKIVHHEETARLKALQVGAASFSFDPLDARPPAGLHCPAAPPCKGGIISSSSLSAKPSPILLTSLSLSPPLPQLAVDSAVSELEKSIDEAPEGGEVPK